MIDPAEFHASILTLDSHIDIPWPDDADPFGPTERCVDLPKMRAGGLRAGCFVAYVPQGPRTPEGNQAALDRALAMLETINALSRTANGVTARITPTVAEIKAARRCGAIAIIPAVENGYTIGDDISLLARFRRAGARYLTLTHNGHNALADSCNPKAEFGDAETLHGGLSELGQAAVAELNRLGMLVDISHVSRQASLQAAMLSRTPVLATHSSVRALCDVRRNLDDTVLDALRDTGGMVGITAVPPFVRARGSAETVTVADFVNHIDYVVQRCGLAHVGIGSDFDGGGGVAGWRDASQSVNVTAELLRRGYSEHEIEAIWSGNFLRLLQLAEDVANELGAAA